MSRAAYVIVSVGAVLASLSGISVHAQNEQITLDDLRRALANSESNTSDSSEAPTTEEVDEAEATESTIEPSPQAKPITLDDLRQALGSPPESETEPNTSTVAEQIDGAVETERTVVASTPAPEVPPLLAYPTDLSKWVCQIAPADRPTPDVRISDDGSQTSLFFPSADYMLNRNGVVGLARNAQSLRELSDGGDGIAVVGYTDALGDPSANIILSLQRAYNIKACLIELVGIDERDILVSGHGNFSPILQAPEADAAGNRRVDILSRAEYRQRFEDAFSALNR